MDLSDDEVPQRGEAGGREVDPPMQVKPHHPRLAQSRTGSI